MSHRSIASPVTAILLGLFFAILIFFAFRVLELDKKIKKMFNQNLGLSFGEIFKKPNINLDNIKMPNINIPDVSLPDINLPNFGLSNGGDVQDTTIQTEGELSVEVIEAVPALSEEEFLDDGPLLTSAYAYMVTSPSVTACEFDLTPKKVTFEPTSRVIRATLTKMFDIGISTGIENPSLGKGFSVFDITIQGDLAIIELNATNDLMDYCEKKKFKSQVKSVATQFPNVRNIELWVNGVKM